MILKDLCALVEGKVMCGEERLGENIDFGFASDLMSDVLTLKAHDFALITGLANIQAVRTAEMSDVSFLVICRGKHPSDDMVELAEDNNMVLIESPFSLFKCAGVLYANGLKAIY